MVFIRSPYNYDVEAASNEATIKDRGESLTVQSQSEDTDINVMMKRFGVTGKMPDNPRIPQYGDFSGISDYRSAMQAIIDAEDGFMELLPEVRSRFENDPQKLLEFMANESNREEAVKLGLVKATVPPVAPAVPVQPVIEGTPPKA